MIARRQGRRRTNWHKTRGDADSYTLGNREQVEAPVPSHSASPREPFIPAPERYDGDLGLCRSFLLQCSLVFELQPQTYPTDKARIAYLIGALRCEALAWAMAVWERGSVACSIYSAFTEEMRRVFDHPVPSTSPSRFPQRCLLRSRVSDSCGGERLKRGGFLERESSDLEHLIALAIRVDNRLRERRRERALRFSSTPSSMPPAASCPPLSVSFPPRHERTPLSESEPMQIGRTHLSPEEREHRPIHLLSGLHHQPRPD